MTGRVLACSQLHHMMHIARELCGGQICITPDAATFRDAGNRAVDGEVLFSVNENWQAEDRRKLLAFARDLLNSDYAGHRLTFQLFAQSPPFAQSRGSISQFRLGGDVAHCPRIGGSFRSGSARSDMTMVHTRDPEVQHGGYLSGAKAR